MAQNNNASKIFAAEIDIKELELKFNLVVKNENKLSMNIVSMTPSNVEVKNSTFISNLTLVDEFIEMIHTNHIS